LHESVRIFELKLTQLADLAVGCVRLNFNTSDVFVTIDESDRITIVEKLNVVNFDSGILG
jgi:hypothetical protein